MYKKLPGFSYKSFKKDINVFEFFYLLKFFRFQLPISLSLLLRVLITASAVL